MAYDCSLLNTSSVVTTMFYVTQEILGGYPTSLWR